MSLIFDFIGRLASLALRLLLALAAAVFAVSLLLAVALLVLFSLLRALLTGRKAAPVVLWQHYRQASSMRRPGSAGIRPASRTSKAQGDVVDVQARDLPPGPR